MEVFSIVGAVAILGFGLMRYMDRQEKRITDRLDRIRELIESKR